MLRDLTIINVRWWKYYDVSAKEIFEVNRIKSNDIMEGKLATSHPTVDAMIGSRGAEMMRGIPKAHLS